VIPSDADLIASVRVSDDRAAFGQLVLRHQSAVRSFLRHLTSGDFALADDLAQETFILAYRRLDHFRGESSFVTWLLGIAHNHWRNARRRQRDQTSLDDTIPAVDRESDSHASDLRQDLAGAMRGLSPDEQLAIHLNYQQGRSHSEIATLLSWPIGTVKTHLTRAKEKLRQHLAAWNPTN
jgi:RNA polymerase sigma-70 factor (ECF subfamily)